MEGVTDAWVNVDDDDKIIDSISEKEVENKIRLKMKKNI